MTLTHTLPSSARTQQTPNQTPTDKAAGHRKLEFISLSEEGDDAGPDGLADDTTVLSIARHDARPHLDLLANLWGDERVSVWGEGGRMKRRMNQGGRGSENKR